MLGHILPVAHGSPCRSTCVSHDQDLEGWGTSPANLEQAARIGQDMRIGHPVKP
jgi:hypothetical protein